MFRTGALHAVWVPDFLTNHPSVSFLSIRYAGTNEVSQRDESIMMCLGRYHPKHGVCVYVHYSVLIDSIDAPISNVLTFRLVSLNVYVIVVYRPPSNTPHANN